MTDYDTATVAELRTALHRGDAVSPAQFRAAEERDEAALGSVLDATKARRAADLADPHRDDDERQAARTAARAVASESMEGDVDRIERMRLAHQDRHRPGGAPLTRTTTSNEETR